jgi:PEP-CTERM motif
MHLSLRIALAAAVVVATSTPSHADVIVWHVPAQLGLPNPDSPHTEYLQLFGMESGQRLDFYLTIDTEAPDLCESPDVGLYGPFSLTFTWNGHAGASVPQDPFFIERSFHSFIGSCAFDPYSPMLLRAAVGGEGIPFNWVVMSWGGPPGDDLPRTPPEFGGFSVISPLSSDWDGEIGPASIVPEPATLLLIASGLVAAATRRRSHRCADQCRV